MGLRKGQTNSGSFKKGLTPWIKGKKHSEEANRKNRLAHLGKKASAETKRKMSEDRKGEKHPMFGQKHTLEARKKMREKRLLQIIPKKDTKPEKFMQKLLTDAKIEFKKHKPILGQPDVFIEPNICIFVDGDYPHANPNPFTIDGRHFPGFKPDDHIQGKTYAKGKWTSDASVTKRLKAQKMIVERIWQSELQAEPEKCLQKIIKIIKEAT